MNRVNRVNRAQGGGARGREDHGGTAKNARQVWSNVEALKGLLARADRELAREPGGYVAVAVVGGDKREEQVGRWGWTGSRDAGGRVAVAGNGLVAGARGLRVRVHREGGGLVGSALLRRTVTVPEHVSAPRVPNREVATPGPDRLAAVEARMAQMLARAASQEREITMLKATIAEMGPVRESMRSLHARLDALEALADPPEDDSDREDRFADAEDRDWDDDDGDEPDEHEDDDE